MVTQIVTLCDVCYDDDVEAKADTHLVAVAGGAWSLELCPSHYDELVAPLADVAERLGQVAKDVAKPKATKGKPAGGGAYNRRMTEPCLLCGEHINVASSLTTHYGKAHNVDGMAGAYGLVCPLCTHEGGSAVATAAHVKREHPEVVAAEGGGGMAEAFRYAWDMGDPHDVVGKRLAHHGLEAMPPRVGSVKP